MERIVDTLDTPLFLVAMPQVLDPFFNRSVVLLLEHSEQGSFGLIVNRATELPLSSVLSEVGIDWKGAPAQFAFFGGPVHPNAGSAVFGEGPLDDDEDLEPRIVNVAQGLRLSIDLRVLSAIGRSPVERFRLILGSSGWTAGQLEQELDRNDWLIAPFDADLLFNHEGHAMWEEALRSIGVRPESLPSWTMNESGDAN